MTQKESVPSRSPARLRDGTADRRLRRTLGNDLRASVMDAAAALLFSGIAFAILAIRLRRGADPAALEMPSMVGNGGIWPYSLSQAIGWSALFWSWLTILLGVSLPILAQRRPARWLTSIEAVHRSTSLTLVGLMVLHAVLLIWDKMGDTLVTCFVPWTTSYLPGRFPQMLGILSFYLAVILGMGFYARSLVGALAWRTMHRYFVPAVYMLAVWHTFAYGSDVTVANRLGIALWIMQLPVVAAFAFRISTPLRRVHPSSAAQQHP